MTLDVRRLMLTFVANGSIVWCSLDDKLFHVYVKNSPVVNCTLLETPSNGELDEDGVSFGSEVTYSCDIGYVLSGDTSRTCQPDGNWTGSDPMCNSM